MAEMLVTKRVTVTSTDKQTLLQLPANRGAVATYYSMYNAGSTDAVVQVFENDTVKDEIPLAAGEHIALAGEAIWSFKEGSRVQVALTASGNVRVTVTFKIK